MLSNSNAQKPAEGTPSSFGDLPLEVISEDDLVYSVDLINMNHDYVIGLHDAFLQAKETFSPVGKLEDRTAFISRLVRKDGVFLSIKLNGFEVGVAYVTDIIPGYSANFNFLFWDRRTKGRQKLILRILRWLSDEFLIHRFELRCHALAYYAIHRLYKLGAFYEGTKRKAWRYEDKVIDLHIFSILSSEIGEDDSFIHRTPAQRKWYGKLTKGGSNA